MSARPAIGVALGALLVATGVLAYVRMSHSAERRLREHLEGEGLEDITLTAIEGKTDAFSYTATRGLDSCVGRVSLAKHKRGLLVSDQMSCHPDPEDCSKKTPRACYRLGQMYTAGDTSALDSNPINLVGAGEYFRTGCEGGHAPCCNALGLAHLEARGVLRDPAKAQALFDKACKADYPKGCFNLALGHHHAEPPEHETAAALYAKACSMGLASGCYNSGVFLRDGIGGARQPEKAAVAFRSACHKRYFTGCVNLGVMYATGDGIEVDKDRAKALFAHACSAGVQEGCMGLDGL